MCACLVLYFVCIHHTSTRPDPWHIHRTSAQEYKSKSLKQGPRSSKTAHEPLKNKPKQRNRTQPVHKLPPLSQSHKWAASFLTHTHTPGSSCNHVCESVCVYDCVCTCVCTMHRPLPAAFSVRGRGEDSERGWREPPSGPQAILNIPRPCTTGGTGVEGA